MGRQRSGRVAESGEFLKSYGTKYINAAVTGGEYTAYLEIKTSCTSDRNSLRAKIGVTAAYKTTADFSDHLQRITSGRDVSIHAAYRGGPSEDVAISVGGIIDKIY